MERHDSRFENPLEVQRAGVSEALSSSAGTIPPSPHRTETIQTTEIERRARGLAGLPTANPKRRQGIGAAAAVLAVLLGFALTNHGLMEYSLTVTQTDYERIESGMTYGQVLAIIGAPGVELSRSEIAGYATVMYSWKNWNGSNMNAVFQNDRLVTKAQFGIP